MLDVEEGEDRWSTGRRHGNGERVMDDVGAVETLAKLPRTERGAAHGQQPPRDRHGRPVPRRDDRLEAVGRVRREGWHDCLVVVLADPRQRTTELASVRFAPARDPGDQREQRQGHAHGAILGGRGHG
jgi:hypothetical protein